MKRNRPLLFIIITLTFLTVIAPLAAQELIPRRILFTAEDDLPAMVTEVLYSEIASAVPIVAVDEGVLHHNTIEATETDGLILFRLLEGSRLLGEAAYPSLEMADYENLAAACRDTAILWTGKLGLVPPTVSDELLQEYEKIEEDVDLELRLATKNQLTLWMPVSLIILISDNISFAYMAPIGAEYFRFFKENLGLTASLSYEYQETSEYGTFHRFIPAVGVVFRTLGRVSAEITLKYDGIIFSNDGQWSYASCFEFAPAISWNFSDQWSAKAMILQFIVDPTMFTSDGMVTGRSYITLMTLGGAYRW